MDIKTLQTNTLFICLILNSLSSISIIDIPLPWIGTVLIILLLLSFQKVHINYFILIPTITIFCLAIILNISNYFYYELIILDKMTTPYYLFVMIRYLNTLSYLAMVMILIELCIAGKWEWIIKFIVNLGVLVSFYAVYVYFAQTYNFSELLPRSRLGTAAGAQSIVFSYEFHRAMGSFREPSHLAEFLMVPFILAFLNGDKLVAWKKIIIFIVIFLTGSMSAILSLFIGLFFIYSINILYTVFIFYIIFNFYLYVI